MIYVFGVIVVFVVVLIAKGVRIVPQAKVMVIERLGKYHQTLQSGLNIIIPILDKPRPIAIRENRKGMNGRTIVLSRMSNEIDLRESVHDFPRQNVITRDNVVIEIDAIIYYQIVDPVKSLYEIVNLNDAIEKLAKTTLRNIIGDMDLDHTLSSRDEINSHMTKILDEATDKWGVKVNRVEIQDINPPQDIKDAMEKQMRAERTRRAAILTAEGEKQAQILESEGERQKRINEADGFKESQVLRAKGEAEAKIQLAEAESEAINLISKAIEQTEMDPARYLIALKYMDTLNAISSGKDSKIIYMPYEATGVISSIGSLKDMFGQGN